ncbi:hypothetical protein SCHPADRAFT_497226 [Schizopora paradoxa]|uniref:Uncharacterized protein n=1 Tax=Schizopora paradoxa TaxID=27342 RepID=A0A0H2RGG6_9AGAM|nr:hypothetical protein SCHPADRAFT_497226 [Schizopora paradoxa]
MRTRSCGGEDRERNSFPFDDATRARRRDSNGIKTSAHGRGTSWPSTTAYVRWDEDARSREPPGVTVAPTTGGWPALPDLLGGKLALPAHGALNSALQRLGGWAALFRGIIIHFRTGGGGGVCITRETFTSTTIHRQCLSFLLDVASALALCNCLCSCLSHHPTRPTSPYMYM